MLTPHLLQPSEGDSYPGDVGIMRAGVYNLGFLGVGGTAEVPAIIDWWARRLRHDCVFDPQRGLFVDQKFIDLVPGFADHVHILREPRYNVAYWNLDQRNLVQHGDAWQVDGEQLGFFHFSGFDCSKEDCLSRHTQAFRDGAISAPLRALLRRHAGQVLLQGYRDACRIAYGYGCFASGVPIPDHARRIFRTQHGDWSGDPFTYFTDDVPPLGPPLLTTLTADEMMGRMQDLYAWTSWRITRPLRAVKRLLFR